jgi:hypothetical protein
MADAAARLRSHYDHVKRQHRGESGRAREIAVAKEVLDRFLPKKLAVASGEVVAANGETSPAHDILVFDAHETPVFDDADGSVVVPIEGVYAVVEVASTLDAAKLRQDAEKIKRLKQMPKSAYFRQAGGPIVQSFNLHGRECDRFPILGFCFGYTGTSLNVLRAELEALDETHSLHERVDMVCSLQQGCIANGRPTVTETGERIFTDWNGFPDPNSERFCIPIDSSAQPGVSLMLFFLLAFGPVSQAHTDPIRLVPYMEMR